ncbi:MAG TPA: hypothetical protein VMY77_05895 [Chitinophagaceae bacterium]|nr:hypothetical protein [Chitinophagaceae bacterium]
MNRYMRPLTKTMLAKLIFCRELEIQGQLCMPEDIKYALAPLYKRGYIGLRKERINGKELMAVFTTPEGIHYLEYANPQSKAS